MSNLYEYIDAEKLMKSEHDSSWGLTKIVLPWSGAAVRKNDTGTVLCKTQPWVAHKGRRQLSQVSNGHLQAFKRSTVYAARFLDDGRVAENCALDRLQCQKKIKFWGSSDGILPLGWIDESLRTLPYFHQLLIRPYPTHGLEVTEFCRSTSLLNSVSGQNSGWMELNFWVSD
jgi:hypothetical protein